MGQSRWDQPQVPKAEFSLSMGEGLPEPRGRAGKPRALQARPEGPEPTGAGRALGGKGGHGAPVSWAGSSPEP